MKNVGADANKDPDCARLAVVDSIQSFWSQALPQQADQDAQGRVLIEEACDTFAARQL